MAINYDHECPRGHEIYADDLGWCTTCDATIYEIWNELMDATGSGPFPQDAMWNAEHFDNRLKDLLYGFNDDSVMREAA